MRITLIGALAAIAIQAVDVSAESLDQASRAKWNASVDKAVGFLRENQLEDGRFADGDLGPPITGLVIAGVLRTGRVGLTDPLVAKGMKYLESKVGKDGGLDVGGGNRNYATAIALLAFAAANKDNRYQPIIDKAVAYLKNEQWDEGEGIDEKNPKYGGAGYGRKSRPDLSNTSFLLEALNAAKLPKDDPAYKRAEVFIRRCQNLSGAGANDLATGGLIDDGGFYYTPAEDYNPGGGTAKEGLRSYGSMTYAGLKSFIHAGVDANDFRVKAAVHWIKKHYTLTENPGLGQQGLFYYYQTFGKALQALDIQQFTDEKGGKHDWRAELVDAIADKQKPDGSWSNANTRWMEGDGRLVTAYALLALASAGQ